MGGFHRYATDAQWRIPHFEKTLSDQAQLAAIYCDAYQITHDPFFAAVAHDILDFSLREMQVPGDAFASALDAESVVAGGAETIEEGAFYTWTKDEVERLLRTEESAIFEYRYGVTADGNTPLRQSGSPRKNILFEMHTVDDTARHFGINNRAVSTQLDLAIKILQQARAQRRRPSTDDKVIAAWNGMMIAALAHASRILNDPGYLAAAEAAAQFLRSHLYDTDSKRLWRSYRAGTANIHGFLDDYTGVIHGLLELYEADFNIGSLQWAVLLQETQDEMFWDEQRGGYFDVAGGDQSVLARLRETQDNADPSPNSAAAMNLLHLALITGRSDWQDRAHRTMASYGALLANTPEAVSAMASALEFDLARKREVVVAGEPGAADTDLLLGLVNQRFLPNKILLLADGGSGQQQLTRWLPFIANVHPLKGKATAYVCDNYACKLPTADPDVAARLLDSKP